MCSTVAARIARICRAIDELAGRSGEHGSRTAAAATTPPPGDATGTSDTTGIAVGTGIADATGTSDATGIADATGTSDATDAGGAAGTADSSEAAGIDEAAIGDGPGAHDDVADRLAAIWAMLADVDPELAKRLPGYLTAAE